MKAYISVIIRDRDIKFSEYMLLYFIHKNLFLDFSHASMWVCKSKISNYERKVKANIFVFRMFNYYCHINYFCKLGFNRIKNRAVIKYLILMGRSKVCNIKYKSAYAFVFCLLYLLYPTIPCNASDTHLPPLHRQHRVLSLLSPLLSSLSQLR